MPREYYSVGEAAKTLGISVDTIRRWDRQGRLKTERDAGNRRIVPASEIERLRGDARSGHLSARNRFNGTVTDVKIDGLMAQVELVVDEPMRLVALDPDSALPIPAAKRVDADPQRLRRLTDAVVLPWHAPPPPSSTSGGHLTYARAIRP